MRVLHLDKNHPLLESGLVALGIENDTNFTGTKLEVERHISSYEGIVIRSRFHIDKHFLDLATKLRFIARVGAGLENIDIDYAQSKGVVLISAPEGNANAVGEHTLAMILNLFNNINISDTQIRKGQWLREVNRGEELAGKTIGIIGYGNMGKSFARKIRGFDVETLCYDIKEDVGDKYASQVSLEILQRKAQVLSLHVPHTKKTIGLINKRFINKMSCFPFWIVNTSRGSCVRIKDLVEAISIGQIRGAALDVLEYEESSFERLHCSTLPEEMKWLMSSDKVLLTPHIAGWSYQSKEKMARIIVEKIKDHFFTSN